MTPWITAEELAECNCFVGEIAYGHLQSAVDLATEILFNLSGRRWPGTATSTIRPCSKTIADAYADSAYGEALPFYPVRSGGVWYNSVTNTSCACFTSSECGCTDIPQLTLGRWWVQSITEVKIDGVVLDPSAYRLDQSRKLVRVDGGTWPCCQNLLLADTEEGTFSVTFVSGKTPPPGAIVAAQKLACEIAKAYDGQDCELPERITSITREGVTMALIDPQEFIAEGRTGIYTVDLWLHSVNPNRIMKRGSVWSPDMKGRVR